PSATPSPGVAEPDGPRNRLTRNGPAGAVPALRTLNDAVIGRPVPANAGPLTAVICRSIKSSITMGTIAALLLTSALIWARKSARTKRNLVPVPTEAGIVSVGAVGQLAPGVRPVVCNVGVRS